MLIKALRSAQLQKYRKILLNFALKYGDQRITQKAMHWLHTVTPEQLNEHGNLLLIAIDSSTIIGLSCTAGYGNHSSFIVIHPQFRGNQIGQKFISEQMNHLGKFTCTVAADNVPSLKMCFRAGLCAVELFDGPTGKPTLRFESIKKIVG